MRLEEDQTSQVFKWFVLTSSDKKISGKYWLYRRWVTAWLPACLPACIFQLPVAAPTGYAAHSLAAGYAFPAAHAGYGYGYTAAAPVAAYAASPVAASPVAILHPFAKEKKLIF